MTYSEAMEVRDRVRARQPVDKDDLTEANRVIALARGLPQLDASDKRLELALRVAPPQADIPEVLEQVQKLTSPPSRVDVVFTVQRGQVWEVFTRSDRYEAEVLGEIIEYYGQASPGRVWVRRYCREKATPLQALLSMFTDCTGGYKYIRG